MKLLKSFPLSIVAKTSAAYNKAFHAKLFTLFASSESEVYAFAKRLTPHYDYCYAFMQSDEGQWFLDPRGIDRVRAWVLRGARKGTTHVKKLYRMWQKDWSAYLKYSTRLLKSDLMMFSDHALYASFSDFYERYLRVGSIAYSADAFMSTGVTDWLEELIRAEVVRLGITTDVAGIVRLLTSPVHLSFTIEEEVALLKLAMSIAKTYPNTSPSVIRALQRHEHRFFWIRNNYYHVEYVDAQDIHKRARKIILDAKRRKQNLTELYRDKMKELKVFRAEREHMLVRIGLRAYYRNVLEIATLFAKWKDIRKSGVYIGMHHFDCFLGEIARRLHVSKSDLTFLAFHEIRDVFLQGKDMRKEIDARKERAFFAITPKGYCILSGEKALRYFPYFIQGQPTADVHELRGVAASPGKVRGRVRVIRKTEEMIFFKHGEILVTNQTTPEFVPIMRKAAAIVTEQGGITSHAAVISRELRKPCVIGTKIATHVFKNGDPVEVDATSGVVRKI